MRISVVTISLNNLHGLKKTVKSVLDQTYARVQFVVIDGGSTDGSIAYLDSQKDGIDYLVSEPDNGVYDAMNKGVMQATGDYILFLNSGDSLYSPVTLADFASFAPVEDVVYGNAMFIRPDGSSYLKEMPADLLNPNVVLTRTLNHQCTFVKKELFANKQFDEEYLILADWAFYSEMVLIHGKTFRHVPLVVANYDLGGMSSDPSNEQQMTLDRQRFFSKFYPEIMNLFAKRYMKLMGEYNRLNSSRSLAWARKLKSILMPWK